MSSSTTGARNGRTLAPWAVPARSIRPPRPALSVGRRRSRSLPVGFTVGVAAGLVLAFLVLPSLAAPLLSSLGTLGGGDGSASSDPPSGGAPSNTSAAGTSCGSDSTPTPSSVLVPIAAPTTNLQAGGTLTATFEIAAVSSTGTLSRMTIYLPSVFATFPLSSGSSLQLYVPPHSFSLTGTGWNNGSTWSKAVVESNVSFLSSGSAGLSTEKLAVMANASYGALTLEIRWHWSLLQPNGSTSVGNWSVPSTSAHWPASTPSEFDPAPFVTLLSTNGPTETIGGNFTADLAGIVGSRYFFLELESSSTGKVDQNHGQTEAAGATTADVTIQVLNYDRFLYPGSYLVHVHDVCGALLLSISVTAVYAATAHVTVEVQPSSCGKVTLNGSAYASGGIASLPPSSTPYSFSIPGCSGRSFSGWGFSGGLYLYSSSQLLVSSSGTITVTYS
ncbi:MAG: hypothetical protein L3K17_08760 [Thermoplasmata archaeon]|nr:hypothetical protein [Thermoplasmata archaeon]